MGCISFRGKSLINELLSIFVRVGYRRRLLKDEGRTGAPPDALSSAIYFIIVA